MSHIFNYSYILHQFLIWLFWFSVNSHSVMLSTELGLPLLKVYLPIAFRNAYLNYQCCLMLLAIHPWPESYCYMGSHSACWKKFSSLGQHKELRIAAHQEVRSEWLWVPTEKDRRIYCLLQYLSTIYLQSNV